MLGVLAAIGPHCTVEPKDLAAVSQTPESEVGVLIVPFDGNTDLDAISAPLKLLRAAGVYVSVLGVTATCACASNVTLGPVFDDVVSMQWHSAAQKIGRFLRGHHIERHGRAFRAFLDTSVDGYWIWDLPRDHIEWSQRTCEMVGVSLTQAPSNMGEFIGMTHPNDRMRLNQAIENHVKHGTPYRDVAFRLRLTSGGYGDFVANGQALRDPDGRPILLVGSLTDRTLMRRVEQQLVDTQQRYTVLFHRMNDAAALADIETGLIVEANEPAERLWGRSIADLVGSHQTSLHPKELSDEAKLAFVNHIDALMQNKRDSIHVPVLHKDGREIPCEISSSLIEINGKTMILGVFRDITEREKSARDLRERDAQLQLSSHLASMGTLAAGVAHEINNPLTYLLGNLEFLRDHLGDSPRAEVAEALDTATTGAHYLREIVADLKVISRMDAAETSCNPAKVIGIATRMAMSDLRHRATLNLDLQDVPAVALSSARLTQVALNVLSNAAHSFDSNDRRRNIIDLRIAPCTTGVQLTISDNGVGIAAEDLKRVCEPFFTRNESSGGTGLGLSICRSILTEAGGTMTLASQPGHGTTVTITLPFQDPLQAKAVERAASPLSPTRRARVMVLDDDALVARLVGQLLGREFDVSLYTDPLKALEMLKSGAPFDAILCDLMMPDMSGRDFYTAVNALPGQAHNFLFLTGGGVTQDSIEMENLMRREGRLMMKPFDSKLLRERVRKMTLGPEADVAPNHPSSDTVQDLEAILGPRKLTEQYEKLMADVITTQAKLAEDLAAQDGIRLATTAHRLGGAAGILGVVHISEICCAIERSVRSDTALTQITPLLDQLAEQQQVFAAMLAQRHQTLAPTPAEG